MSINLKTAYKASIKIPFGKLQQMLEWVDKNCVGEVKYMEDPNEEVYNSWVFFFENERDYVAFLMWKK